MPQARATAPCIIMKSSLPANSLQHSATLCNTPQHTATHCKHAATHCNPLHATGKGDCTVRYYEIVDNQPHIHYVDQVCFVGLFYCNTLQHTATRYILQHTATHCNTLQHTASSCNTLQRTGTHCNTLQHTATHCNTLQHTATRLSCHRRQSAAYSTTLIRSVL